ncbi:MAG: MFS transporter [Alphaproteobacteria bacterium]|nr:MAG: MFS transporter [Alphaproteobacteria bacterium]
MSDLQVGEFKRGWPVVVSAAIGIGLGLSPLPFYTIDVMVGPLSQEFNWSRGDVYSALAIYTIGAFLMSPVIGLLSERFGARRVALTSILTFGLSMMALSLNTGDRVLYLILWLMLAVGGAGTLPITFTRPINTWFENNRGLALGLALIATGVFGALAKSYAQFMVDWVGWRGAYIALGALPILIALPIALLSLRDVGDTPAPESKLVRHKTPVLSFALAGTAAFVWFAFSFIWPQIETRGLRLEYAMALVFMVFVLAAPLAVMLFDIKKHPPVPRTHGGPVELPGLTLGEALRTWRFCLLAIVFVPISYSLGAIIPSLVPLLAFKGYPVNAAVSLATLTGLAVLGGRLIGGFLIDRFWAPGVAFLFLASPAFALYLLTGEVSPGVATIAILMIGFGAGVEYDFMAYLCSRYFGMRRYSAIYGALYGFFAVGAGFGPAIMNNRADANGWDQTLIEAAVILFIATLPLLALGRYRTFPAPLGAQDIAAAPIAASAGNQANRTDS